MSQERKIIVWDSGKGANYVYSKLSSLFNNVHLFSDHENFPYGNKSFDVLSEIFQTTVFNLNLNEDDVLVIACNTMSCVYKQLQDNFIFNFKLFCVLDFVLQSEGCILCTMFTANYLSLQGVQCLGLMNLAQLIEFDSNDLICETIENLNLIEAKYVYGCTHYAIVDNMFKKIYPKITFIDPEVLFCDYLAEAVKLIN